MEILSLRLQQARAAAAADSTESGVDAADTAAEASQADGGAESGDQPANGRHRLGSAKLRAARFDPAQMSLVKTCQLQLGVVNRGEYQPLVTATPETYPSKREENGKENSAL